MAGGRTRTIPPLRVSEEMRADAESVLAPGETLSAFVLDAVARTIELRRSQRDFVARGLASAEQAQKTGNYISAKRALDGLRRRFEHARHRQK